MVINHPNVFSAKGCPDKAGADLVTDAAAVLPFWISAQGFQSVAWSKTKISESASSIKLV
jgi:hypothetical protein